MKDLNAGPTQAKPLISAKAASVIGFAFIIPPGAFLAGIFMKYWVGITFDSFTTLEEAVTLLDKSPNLTWVNPLIFIALPFVGACINTLAITQVYRDKLRKQFLITVHHKFLNLGLIFISLSIVAVFIFHMISGLIHHTAALVMWPYISGSV